jgi:hypothetical protein
MLNTRAVPRGAGKANTMVGAMIMLVVVIVLWSAFGALLIFDPEALESLWRQFSNLPLAGKAVLTILFLPWVAGLWVWQEAWPLAARLPILTGLACVTIYLFLQGVLSVKG